MKACTDMRQLIQRLAEVGELVRVEEEVDPTFQLSSLIRHEEDGPNRAILFSRVKGSKMAAVANLYGSMRRCALGCGIEVAGEDLQRRKRDPHGGPGGMGGNSITGFAMSDVERASTVMLKERILAAEKEAARGDGPTRLVDSGPCKEVIVAGDIDLSFLPVPWLCQGDAGPYITAGGLVLRDPDTGVLNIGGYRHQVSPETYGKNRMGALIGEVHDAFRIFRKYEEKGEACPVALCLGLEPAAMIATWYTSPNLASPTPYSEFNLASALMGSPLEVVKCETVDLEVPASTEIVLEGVIPPNQRIQEGPMAEFTDMHAQTGPLPYIEVRAITHRREPIFQALMSGRSEEHRVGSAFVSWGYEQSLLTRLRRSLPNVKDVAIYSGSHGSHLVVSMQKRYPGQDRELLHHLLGTSYYKYITIVDDDIEPHNSEQVEWARATRAGSSPDDFLVVPRMPTWQMDPLRDEDGCVTKLGILATLPFGQSYQRCGPPAEVLEATRELYERALG